MDRASDVELLDAGVLLTLHEFRVPGEPDPAADVAQAFRDATPARVQQLQAAAARRDVEEVRRLAHQIRGSCGAVGATAMAHVSAEIESLDRDADATLLAQTLLALFSQTEPLLAAVVRDGAVAGDGGPAA